MSKLPNHGATHTTATQDSFYDVSNIGKTMGLSMIVVQAMIDKIYEQFEFELMVK